MRSARPVSSSNQLGLNQTMNTKIQEMDKQFRHVSLGKEKNFPERKERRLSLTESESSDISTALSANR